MKDFIWAKTTSGLVALVVKHRNKALQVVKAIAKHPEVELYNTVHNNGFMIPFTESTSLEKAISLCDFCVDNFPELNQEIFNTNEIPKNRQKEIKFLIGQHKLYLLERELK